MALNEINLSLSFNETHCFLKKIWIRCGSFSENLRIPPEICGGGGRGWKNNAEKYYWISYKTLPLCAWILDCNEETWFKYRIYILNSSCTWDQAPITFLRATSGSGIGPQILFLESIALTSRLLRQPLKFDPRNGWKRPASFSPPLEAASIKRLATITRSPFSAVVDAIQPLVTHTGKHYKIWMREDSNCSRIGCDWNSFASGPDYVFWWRMNKDEIICSLYCFVGIIRCPCPCVDVLITEPLFTNSDTQSDYITNKAE